MGEPLVSVIIPVYNGEATVVRCLKSVLFQDYLNLEILALTGVWRCAGNWPIMIPVSSLSTSPTPEFPLPEIMLWT